MENKIIDLTQALGENATFELQKFDVTAAALEQMKEYLALEIKGIDDTAGYEVVKRSRINVKNTRVKVEKNGAELRKKKRAEIEDYIKMVFKVEKYILGELLPIEDYLSTQQKAIDDEKERIKREAEEAETARIQARITLLFDLGCRFDNVKYSYGDLFIFAIDAKSCKDEQFEAFVHEVREKIIEEQAIKAEEERKRKEENDRLAKVAEEQEAERTRLLEAAKELADKEEARLREERKVAAERKAEEDRIKAEAEEREARIKAEAEARFKTAEKKLAEEKEAAEREIKLKAAEEEKRIAEERAKLEAEKKELQDKKDAEEAEKKRLQEIKEAEERARLEAEEKIKRDAEAKAVADRLAKEEAERQEALRPDKEKLLLFASSIELLPAPDMTTEDGRAVLSAVEIELAGVVRRLRKKVEGL